MQRYGLNQKKMAEQVGVSQVYVSQLLNGAKPSIDGCRKIAEVTGYTVLEVMVDYGLLSEAEAGVPSGSYY
jgi:transcriptional regulator with XRE-family HTH domain